MARRGTAAAGAGSGQQARGQARPGRASARRLGVLAGSAGLVWCTVHLAQLLLSFWNQFDSVLFMCH